MEFHRGAAPLIGRLKELGFETAYTEWPDHTGFLCAWKLGAQLP
ncbi:MAG: hypothetical protein N3E49_00545 [Bacteroidia bacterium]|nr:hypothetical protein [Bacteroidia bacterium]